MKPTLIALFVVGFVLITLNLVFLGLLPYLYGFEVDLRKRILIAVCNIVGFVILMFASVKLRDERIGLRNERKQSSSPSVTNSSF